LVEQLDTQEREMLQLAYWERLSHRDIAHVLGCSENAVDLRLRRIRRELRTRIEALPANVRSKGHGRSVAGL
jgi:RNA polymerase sigma factor (sigma-70 family)